MDNPANPFEQITAQREDIRRRRAALDEEEQALTQSVVALCRSLGFAAVPDLAEPFRTPDGFKPGIHKHRILTAVRSFGRTGASSLDVSVATGMARRDVSPNLTRLKNQGLIRRREGTNLWVAVTPPDGGYATPADGSVS